MFDPHFSIHLSGPNGSVSGFGPKGWPTAIRCLTADGRESRQNWSCSLVLRVPHFSWNRCYKLKGRGGMHIHRWQYAAFRRFTEWGCARPAASS